MLNRPKSKNVMVLSLLVLALFFSGCFGGSGGPSISEPTERSQPPWEEKESWEGELTCSFAVPEQTANACPLIGVGGRMQQGFDLDEDIETLVIGMDWQTSDTSTMDELNLVVETTGTTRTRVGEVSGEAPLTLRLDKEDGIQDYSRLQMLVYPAQGTGVITGQPFTVHYHAFHLEPADDNYSALP